MNFLERLFGSKKEETPKQESNISDKENIAVTFKVKTINVEDLPFELMLNMDLIDTKPYEDFSWLWTITLRAMESDEWGLPVANDRAKLMKFFQEILQTIIKEADVKIIGTSLHKELYDIMFYAKESDSKKIGGIIVDMPSYMQDTEGRFIRFNGLKDSDWENVYGYYEFLRE